MGVVVTAYTGIEIIKHIDPEEDADRLWEEESGERQRLVFWNSGEPRDFKINNLPEGVYLASYKEAVHVISTMYGHFADFTGSYIAVTEPDSVYVSAFGILGGKRPTSLDISIKESARNPESPFQALKSTNEGVMRGEFLKSLDAEFDRAAELLKQKPIEDRYIFGALWNNASQVKIMGDNGQIKDTTMKREIEAWNMIFENFRSAVKRAANENGVITFT